MSVLLKMCYRNGFMFDEMAVVQNQMCHEKLDVRLFKLRMNNKQSKSKWKSVQNLYSLSYLSYLLNRYENCRLTFTQAVTNFLGGNDIKLIQIRFITEFPSKHIIDYKWNEIINNLSKERQELDSALALLSTLGGAFSSLGDDKKQCAVIAGFISVRQLRLAMRLGDPQVQARCRLYFALSLLQRGKLRQARDIVRREYDQLLVDPHPDVRLVRACHGIWAKLQYEWGKRKRRRRFVTCDNGRSETINQTLDCTTSFAATAEHAVFRSKINCASVRSKIDCASGVRLKTDLMVEQVLVIADNEAGWN